MKATLTGACGLQCYKVRPSAKTNLKTIEIIDELANKEKITIKAHQITILKNDLLIDDLKTMKLNDAFEDVRLRLKEELIAILQ